MKGPQYRLNITMGRPQSQYGLGGEEKTSHPAGNRIPVVQSVASEYAYTDWAILTHVKR
jgi:hypothetical protein